MIKGAWGSASRAFEASFWGFATEKKVYGCMDVVDFEDATAEASWELNERNLRRYLTLTGAKLYRGLGRIELPEYTTTSGFKPNPESATQEDTLSTTSSKSGRKRPASASDADTISQAPKKHKATDVIATDVRDRTHGYLVTSKAVVPLGSSTPARQLMEAIRDAIKCTPSYPFYSFLCGD